MLRSLLASLLLACACEVGLCQVSRLPKLLRSCTSWPGSVRLFGSLTGGEALDHTLHAAVDLRWQRSVPNRAAYNPDGTSWGVENAGVSPDFEVEITPRDWMMGRDTQLEKAVQIGDRRVKEGSAGGS